MSTRLYRMTQCNLRFGSSIQMVKIELNMNLEKTKQLNRKLYYDMIFLAFPTFCITNTSQNTQALYNDFCKSI